MAVYPGKGLVRRCGNEFEKINSFNVLQTEASDCAVPQQIHFDTLKSEPINGGLQALKRGFPEVQNRALKQNE